MHYTTSEEQMDLCENKLEMCSFLVRELTVVLSEPGHRYTKAHVSYHSSNFLWLLNEFSSSSDITDQLVTLGLVPQLAATLRVNLFEAKMDLGIQQDVRMATKIMLNIVRAADGKHKSLVLKEMGEVQGIRFTHESFVLSRWINSRDGNMRNVLHMCCRKICYFIKLMKRK